VVVQDRGVADAASAALVERQEGTDMRRRRKYTWFPSNLSPIRGESVDTRVNLNGITGGLAVDGTVQGITTLPLCISDFVNTGSNYEGTIVDPLSEVVGQEYVVERIVGKFFAWTHWAPNTTNSLDASVAVGLGLCAWNLRWWRRELGDFPRVDGALHFFEWRDGVGEDYRACEWARIRGGVLLVDPALGSWHDGMTVEPMVGRIARPS